MLKRFWILLFGGCECEFEVYQEYKCSKIVQYKQNDDPVKIDSIIIINRCKKCGKLEEFSI